jgi:hypothetical protein
MHSPRSPVYGETLARRGLPPSIFKVLLHVCQRSGHTSQIALPHLSSYIMPTCKLWRGLQPPKRDVRQNPSPLHPRGLPSYVFPNGIVSMVNNFSLGLNFFPLVGHIK